MGASTSTDDQKEKLPVQIRTIQAKKKYFGSVTVVFAGIPKGILRIGDVSASLGSIEILESNTVGQAKYMLEHMNKVPDSVVHVPIDGRRANFDTIVGEVILIIPDK